MFPKNGQFMVFDVFLCSKYVFLWYWGCLNHFWRHMTLYNVKNYVNLCMILRNLLKSRGFFYLKMGKIRIPMFSYVENPFSRFLRFHEEILTSYDATRRQKRHVFMYDFKKIIQICMFFDLLVFINLAFFSVHHFFSILLVLLLFLF